MTPERKTKERPEQEPLVELNGESMTPAQPPAENDATQEEYRKAYLEQLRRMSCPGCGEDFTPF